MKESQWIEAASNCCKGRGFIIYLFVNFASVYMK
jgi:hypothetical protein